MAEFETTCPHCGTVLAAQDDWLGMDVACPSCGKQFKITKGAMEETAEPLPVNGTFTFVCPSCEGVAELQNSLLGKEYECQFCFEKHIAEATTERQCPFCGQTVEYHASVCKFCKADLTRTPPESTPAREKTFIFICPECDAVAELPASQNGQKYECPVCCETVVAVPAEERKCPHCGEKVKLKATLCKHCRKKIKPLLPTQEKIAAPKRSPGAAPTKSTAPGRSPSRSLPAGPMTVAPADSSGCGFFEVNRTVWNALDGQWDKFGIFLGAVVVLNLINFVCSVIPLASFFATCALFPLTAGGILFTLRLIRREDPPIGSFFEPFQRYGDFFFGFLRFIFICLLWGLLLIVPGIIAASRYSTTFYIMLDEPELSAKEAMAESAAVTHGHKWTLFGPILLLMWLPILISPILTVLCLHGVIPKGWLIFSGIFPIVMGLISGIYLPLFLAAFYESVRRQY